MFVSEFFKFKKKQLSAMSTHGVFDVLLDKDSNFFINVILLKKATVPEFVEAYKVLNKFFSDIATLLENADCPDKKDKFYKVARNRFNFHEVNGINLGFSQSAHGSGWGNELSDQFLYDAYQIVRKGSKQPELFHLVSLFEEDVGPDRLSDMIATIIEPQIIQYTKRIMKELGITPKAYPNLHFLESGLVENPYKKVEILLLPTEILHEIPIADGWDDIGRVAAKNDTIRREISAEVGVFWDKWASSERKKYLKNNVFMDPDACRRVLKGYSTQDLPPYDIKQDQNYLVELLLKKLKEAENFKSRVKPKTSLIAAREIIALFKDWIENNRGWADIQDSSTQRREKTVQRLLHLASKYYVDVNNFDFSCEPDAGRGPVDVKVSRGKDKTLAEIKLSSSSQYLHGYQVQIQEYAKAERTQNLIYVFVDIGNPRKKQTLLKLYRRAMNSGKPYPELIIVDARQRKAASTFNDGSLEDISCDLPEIDCNLPEINLDPLETDWDNLEAELKNIKWPAVDSIYTDEEE